MDSQIFISISAWNYTSCQGYFCAIYLFLVVRRS